MRKNILSCLFYSLRHFCEKEANNESIDEATDKTVVEIPITCFYIRYWLYQFIDAVESETHNGRS